MSLQKRAGEKEMDSCVAHPETWGVGADELSDAVATGPGS